MQPGDVGQTQGPAPSCPEIEAVVTEDLLSLNPEQLREHVEREKALAREIDAQRTIPAPVGRPPLDEGSGVVGAEYGGLGAR
jgi:hypothetical protein